MKSKNGTKTAVPITYCDVPRETYMHWLEVVFNEIGWRGAAELFAISDTAAQRYVRCGGVPVIEPNELERAYVALRFDRFDFDSRKLNEIRVARRTFQRETMESALGHQSARCA